MNFSIKKICCIGAGYVGGPTMSVLAEKCVDIEINVVDKNLERIKLWNSEDLKNLPIYEPGLETIIAKCRGENLHFSTDLENKIKDADMIFISVNTPTKNKGIGAGQASDLTFIEAAARLIAKHGTGHTIVVEKSTLPIRTADTIKQILTSANKQYPNSATFDILSNPEFLAEGNAIYDLTNPDRILIGGESEDAINCLKNIYLNWVDENRIITTNLWSSELSKLAANAFLAQRVSSINSLSALCEASGADISEVEKAIGTDSRIGNKFISPGPGFGGSCFKKDILNLVYLCNFYGLREVAEYWGKVLEINSWQKNRITKIIFQKLFGTITSKNIAIFGFSFKSNTNDTRESPAIEICHQLMHEGANLKIYDPRVSIQQLEKDLGLSKKDDREQGFFNGSWKFANDSYKAAEGTDAIVILTEWEEFKHLDWKLISTNMRPPSWVFDTRSIINFKEAKSNGMNLWIIGRS
tara:strand:+ start:12530 stop:13936 length:1407 start_codon:yes stop_codon:yes gene_type:complete